MRLLVYLVGPPGAGKTTALKTLTAGYDRFPAIREGCPLVLMTHPLMRTQVERPRMSEWGPLAKRIDMVERVTELGRDRDGYFAGTDALSMSIQPKALRALRAMAADDNPAGWLVLAEGDRLANDSFLQGCEETGWAVRVVYLATSLSECGRRRAERGGGQNEAWVRGRVTKSRRLAERWAASPLDGGKPPAQVAEDLTELIVAWYA